MTFIALVIVVGMVAYCAWIMGLVHEERRQEREEQWAQQAYQWAMQHNRMPVSTYYIDAYTGEVLDEKHQ